MQEPVLKITGVTKEFELGPVKVKALRGVDLEVYQGQMLSIVGASGCGKSTLMNILGLLDRPTAGTYFIEGKDTAGLNDNEISKLRGEKIGFVFQQYNLLPRLDVLDNAAVPLLYQGWPRVKIVPRIRELLKLVGMADREDHTPNELSGGQQQRVAIARALSGAPAIILADEPTGALDSNTSREVIELFTKLNKEEGITIVLITHDMDIANQCPRRILLKDGIIAGDENDYKS